jgi:hypothetical protein
MSSKVTVKPLLARNPRVSEHLLLSSSARGFSAYEDDLDSNVRFILRKYAHLDRQKVSNLLEELDNNRDLAMQILDAEESHCNSILEERREAVRQPRLLSQEEENRLLKQSFLSLYKKFLAASTQLEDAHRKYESERAENEKLRQLNKFLLQGEYSRTAAEDATPIC